MNVRDRGEGERKEKHAKAGRETRNWKQGRPIVLRVGLSNV
ncbi:MAG: hypothetical protein ACTS4U_00905 [Candidatus Hodgkinia cicadicola]